MSEYQPTTAPAEYDAAYLERELTRIPTSLAGLLDLDPPRVAPAKPRDGQVRYFDATIYDPGSGTGVYVYHGAAWNKL